jgi:hypothetical protein
LPAGLDAQGRPLADAAGDVRFLKNPLYSQPLDDAGHVRSKEQVFFVGIVGVPWQDVATDETRDVTGQLELIAASGFTSARLWERILGSKAAGVQRTRAPRATVALTGSRTIRCAGTPPAPPMARSNVSRRRTPRRAS